MVGRGVPSRTREREQIVERRRRLDQLRLGRPAATHRHDDDTAVAGENARDMAGHGRLPDALAEADHGERRRLDRLERRRVEAEVGADVRQPERERARRPEQALPRPEHRLVGEVDTRDPPPPRRARRRAERRSRRRRAASPSRRRAARRRRRTAAPRARRARPARSARRRSGRSPALTSSAPRPRSGPCTSRTSSCRSRTG